jgi:putative flippase GtrA
MPTRVRAQRFGLVSLVTALIGQVSILALHVGLGVGPVLANLLATGLVSLISYFLCTRHVWDSDPLRRYTFELPGFVFASLFGLLLSSITVAVGSQLSAHPLTPNVASAVGFGLAWVARFGLLDRVLFARRELDLPGDLPR